MASTLVACGICGLGVRFEEGKAPEGGVVCENDSCQAELARQVAAAGGKPAAKKKGTRMSETTTIPAETPADDPDEEEEDEEDDEEEEAPAEKPAPPVAQRQGRFRR